MKMLSFDKYMINIFYTLVKMLPFSALENFAKPKNLLTSRSIVIVSYLYSKPILITSTMMVKIATNENEQNFVIYFKENNTTKRNNATKETI